MDGPINKLERGGRDDIDNIVLNACLWACNTLFNCMCSGGQSILKLTFWYTKSFQSCRPHLMDWPMEHLPDFPDWQSKPGLTQLVQGRSQPAKERQNIARPIYSTEVLYEFQSHYLLV